MQQLTLWSDLPLKRKARRRGERRPVRPSKPRESRGWKEKGAWGERVESFKVETFGVEVGAVPGVNEVSSNPLGRLRQRSSRELYTSMRGLTKSALQAFEEGHDRDMRAVLQRIQTVAAVLVCRATAGVTHVSVVFPREEEAFEMGLSQALRDAGG